MRWKLIRVISHPCLELEVEHEKSHLIEEDSVYFIEGPTRTFLKSLDSVKRERDRAVARYDNVLNGLKYWRKRALTEKPPAPKLGG